MSTSARRQQVTATPWPHTRLVPPALGAVDLFLVTGAESCSPALACRMGALLDDQERLRAQAFRRQEDRLRFVAARATLRHMLSRYFPARPEVDWVFTHNPFGKPSVGAPLEFNVSHTEGMIALAISHAQCPVGIDVERADKLSAAACREMYPLVLAPQEQRRFQQIPPAAEADEFVQLWTLKEAWLKATGAGLSIAPATIAFSPEVAAMTLAEGLGDPVRQDLLPLLGQAWHLHRRCLDGIDGGRHHLAVALAAGRHAEGVAPACTWSITTRNVSLAVLFADAGMG